MQTFKSRVACAIVAMAIVPVFQSFLPAAGSAQAQGQRVIEEIVVTARKREETLQDVPFAVQAVSGDELQQRGANSLEDAANNIAGFTVQNLGPGQSQVAIRGISAGQIVRDQPGVKEQVGVYLDESVISLSLFTPDLDFYDMNRIEVLRGPQGTLYGSGSLSGTVKYVSNAPQLQVTEGAYQLGFSQILDGGFGNESKGYINLPHGDRMALRLVGYNTEYGGWIDSLEPGDTRREDVNSGSRAGLRASLKWAVNDAITVTPRVLYQQVSQNGFNREDRFNALANPFTTTRPPISLGENEQYTQLQESFGDEFLLIDNQVTVDFYNFTLTSVSSFTERDVAVLRDASALTLGVISANREAFGIDDDTAVQAVNSLQGPLLDSTSARVLTQEIRLASAGDGPWNWVVGGFYSDIERNYGQNLAVNGFEALTGIETEGQINPTNSLFFSRIPYNFEQIAIFGEVSWAITPALEVSLGARLYDFEETRELNFDGLFASQSIGVPGRTSSDGINPRLLVSYDVTELTQVNAQVARGFRLGGINDPLNTGACNAQDLETFGPFANRFDDEELTNYEIGVKTGLLGGRATLNAAVFYADIENLQVTLDAGSCSSRLVFPVENARAIGMEFEFEAYLGNAFSVAAAGSYVDTEIQSTLLSDGEVVGGVRDGNRFATTPEFQLSLAGTYDFRWGSDWDGFAVLSAQHIGSRFTQLADQEPGAGFTDPSASRIGNAPSQSLFVDPRLPGYQIVNLRVGGRRGAWELAGFINNLLDEQALQSYDRELGGIARLGYRVNQPLTVGTTLSYFFE